MVQVKEIKDENGKQMITKEGKPVRQYKFSAGDIFIPQISKVIEKEGGKNSDGITITNFIIPVKIKGYNEKEEDDAIFINLTPSQYKTIQKKIDSGYDIVKHVFNAYTYYDKDGIERVGIGFRPKKSKPITFDDVEEDIEENIDDVVDSIY